RHLLKSDKAKIVKYEPFTIQLLFECENQVQDITLGINSGYKNVGLSATTDKKELYSAEVKLRDDIVKLISSRRQLRRGRRFRNTRYRPARFDNRKKEDEAHKKQVEKINQILPINKTIVEVSSFDIAKIKNSEIQGKEYQQGEQFESRQTGGNAPNNLITLCKTCDESYHNGKLELKLKREQYPNVNLTYGYITKNIRLENKLRKEKRTDALCITGNPKIIEEVEKDIARMAKNLSEANSGGELESKKRTRVTL
ncbi:15479_t:CDS:2, partial [Funneliformis geosporum]